MLSPCECEKAGWCSRHLVTKTNKEIMKCKKDIQYRLYMDKQVGTKPVEASIISVGQMSNDLLSLVPKITSPSAIVGISRSGLLPASILATTLNLPLFSIDQKDKNILPLTGGARLNEFSLKDGIIYLVDDSSWTGQSMRDTRPAVEEKFINFKVKTLSVYKSKIANNVDIYHSVLPHHFFEWNIHNSVFSIAYDMDGALCRDFTKEEDSDEDLYIKTMLNMDKTSICPVKNPLSIITARLEKYRPQTEEWLNLNGFQVNKLIMGPWESKGTNHEEVAKWKALMYLEHFPNYQLFCESSLEQAKIIFTETSKSVICVETNSVFTTGSPCL